jgi:hypothetical protein
MLLQDGTPYVTEKGVEEALLLFVKLSLPSDEEIEKDIREIIENCTELDEHWNERCEWYSSYLNETLVEEMMIMYKLQYFTTGNELCASDLENQLQTENINLQQVSSLSDIKKFHLPLSGTYKGDYAILSMQNGDRFYIDKKEHSRISEVLSCT